MAMSYVITSKCVGTCDSACVDACPVSCIAGPISVEELRSVAASERGARFPGMQMFIDPDECICCNACVDHCPVDAIYDEGDVPPEHRVDILRNAAFFRR
jgi:ferredoxin